MLPHAVQSPTAEKDCSILSKEIINILKDHIQNKLKGDEITEVANKVVQKYLTDFENMTIVYCKDGVKQSVNKKCENECPTGSINSFISVSSNSLCGNNVSNCYDNNNAIWYNKVCDEPQLGGLYFDFTNDTALNVEFFQ